MSREEVAAHMREMGMTTTTGRVLAAIQERADHIDGLQYGTVLTRIQAGKVQVVEVSETFKSAPEHEPLELQRTGEENPPTARATCRYGWSVKGDTLLHAKVLLDQHIANSK